MEELTHKKIKEELRFLRLLRHNDRFGYLSYIIESKLKHFQRCLESGTIVKSETPGLYHRTIDYYPSATEVAQLIVEDNLQNRHL